MFAVSEIEYKLLNTANQKKSTYFHCNPRFPINTSEK